MVQEPTSANLPRKGEWPVTQIVSEIQWRMRAKRVDQKEELRKDAPCSSFTVKGMKVNDKSVSLDLQKWGA